MTKRTLVLSLGAVVVAVFFSAAKLSSNETAKHSNVPGGGFTKLAPNPQPAPVAAPAKNNDPPAAPVEESHNGPADAAPVKLLGVPKIRKYDGGTMYSLNIINPSTDKYRVWGKLSQLTRDNSTPVIVTYQTNVTPEGDGIWTISLGPGNNTSVTFIGE